MKRSTRQSLAELALSLEPVFVRNINVHQLAFFVRIWHSLPAHGSIVLTAGETITLPGELSHIIEVPPQSRDVILLETSTANNDSRDNIFPFITPSATPVEEDAEPRYQVLGEYVAAASH